MNESSDFDSVGTPLDGRERESNTNLPLDSLIFPTMSFTEENNPPVVALRRRSDGSLVALAFSNLDRLVEAFGPTQDWVAFRRNDLEEVFAGSAVSHVYIDASIVLQDEFDDLGES